MIRRNNRPYRVKEDKNRFYFPHEYQNMFKNLKPKQKHTVHCQFNTGARINELRFINPSTDINWLDAWIILRVTKTKAKKGETKGQPRYIKISTQFLKYLNKYKKKTDLGILSTPAINEGIKKASEKAGIMNPRDFSSHNIRKTVETYMMALNIPDMKICKHLGHDIRTAVSNYISPDIFNQQQKWEMRRLLGDLYEK